MKTMTRQEYEQKYGSAPVLQQDVPEADATRGFAMGLGSGVLKGIGELGLGIGEFGKSLSETASKPVDALLGTKGALTPRNAGIFEENRASDIRKNVLKADQPGEGTGKFLTNVASFAVPGGVAWRATKGANLLTRIGGQVASDVGVQTTQQGGDVNRDTVDTAILAALFPGGQAAMSAAKNKIGPNVGGRIIDSLIKPLKKDLSFGKNPGKAVSNAGITANSFDDLAQKIQREIDNTSQQVKQVYQSKPTSLDISDFTKPIDDALSEVQKNPRTNASTISRLQNLKDDILKVNEEGIPTRQLNNLSANEVLDLKREIGSLTQWTDNRGADDTINKAIRRTYGQLKGKLDEAYPDAKPLNEKIASLISAEQATIHREDIVRRSNIVSLPGVQAGGTGALVGLVASGGSITPALVVGAGAVGLQKAMSTPQGKTRLASWFASLPSEQKKSLLKEAPWVRSTMQAALFDEEDE